MTAPITAATVRVELATEATQAQTEAAAIPIGWVIAVCPAGPATVGVVDSAEVPVDGAAATHVQAVAVDHPAWAVHAVAGAAAAAEEGGNGDV